MAFSSTEQRKAAFARMFARKRMKRGMGVRPGKPGLLARIRASRVQKSNKRFSAKTAAKTKLSLLRYLAER